MRQFGRGDPRVSEHKLAELASLYLGGARRGAEDRCRIIVRALNPSSIGNCLLAYWVDRLTEVVQSPLLLALRFFESQCGEVISVNIFSFSLWRTRPCLETVTFS